MAIPNVSFIRRELAAVFNLYSLIRDCLEGETKVKAKGAVYLPIPNEADTSKENVCRYKAYIKRALFVNFTRRTLAGLVGQIFMRDPVVTIPESMKPIIKDINGEGLDAIQQATRLVQYVCAYARAGLFVDYPTAPVNEKGESGVTTVAELAAGDIRPIVREYSPFSIVNWRTATIGSKTFLTLVVLAEPYCIHDDGFEMKTSGQFRVLRLDPAGNYVQEIWRENNPSTWDEYKTLKGSYRRKQTINVKGADGLPLREIPFSFIGGDNNDSNVDYPIMYDLASVNIAHYRNSADYEEACFITGQPTPALTGLTESWVKDVLNGRVEFGSRAAIMLPVGGAAELLQAEENGMIKEAMEGKERHAAALGAKFVEQKQVERTAFETKVDKMSETSILAQISVNVSTAMTWALIWCDRFMGGASAEGAVEFKLNKDFDISSLTVEQQGTIVAQWQAGSITFEEMRAGLKRAGTATEDDAKAKTSIEGDAEKQMARDIKLAQASKVPAAAAA